jgi:hypothetical protein
LVVAVAVEALEQMAVLAGVAGLLGHREILGVRAHLLPGAAVEAVAPNQALKDQRLLLAPAAAEGAGALLVHQALHQ